MSEVIDNLLMDRAASGPEGDIRFHITLTGPPLPDFGGDGGGGGDFVAPRPSQPRRRRSVSVGQGGGSSSPDVGDAPRIFIG